MFRIVAEEDMEAVCRSSNTLFVLIGNPGIIWHVASNQCVHTTPDRITTTIGSRDDPGI